MNEVIGLLFVLPMLVILWLIVAVLARIAWGIMKREYD